MREFFIELLKELKMLTGVKQYEEIASIEDKDHAQKTLNDLTRALCNVCGTFNYIPDEDKKKIIRKKLLEDVKFYGLTAQKVWQYLNSVSDKYWKESAHIETNKLIEEDRELKPLSAETQKMIDDYLKELSTGIGSRTITNVEIEKQKIKREDSQKKALSSGYKSPSADYVRTQELKRQWARENTDLQLGTILPNRPNFEEWLKINENKS